MGGRRRDETCKALSSRANGKAFLDAVGAPPELYGAYDLDDSPSEGTSKEELSDQEKQKLRDQEKQELRGLVLEIARLVYFQKQIARYYYSDLFHTTKDISTYFEYLYHRISSIRYATSLAALLLKRWDDLRGWRGDLAQFRADLQAAERDPVTCYLHELVYGGSTDAPSAQAEEAQKAHVLRDRLNDIRAFARTLDRDRDVLLSRASSNTLLGWFDWIIKRDLPRFLTRLLGLNDDKLLSQEETKIVDELRMLVRTFQELKCKVLREKTDYDQCISARVEQIDALVVNPEFKIPGPNCPADSRSPVDPVKGLCSNEDRRVRRMQYPALEAVLDISTCLRWLDRFHEAHHVIRWLTQLLPKIEVDVGDEFKDDRDFFELRLHFRKAELILAPLRYWDLKNDKLSARSRLERCCGRALKENKKAMDLIRESRAQRDKYFIYRSYLHSQRGRALALRNHFPAALRELDQAMSGLDGHTGDGRGALAIRALYRAETLTYLSDHKVMQISQFQNRQGQRGDPGQPSGRVMNDPDRLSPQGRFFLGYRCFIKEMASSLGVKGTAKQVFRRAMTPWVQDLPSKPDFLAHVRASLELVKVIDPGSCGDCKTVENALKNKRARQALEQSLAYWDLWALPTPANQGPREAHNAKGGKPPEPPTMEAKQLQETRRTAAQFLEVAHGSLDEAESLLAGGRRDVQFWCMLHRLRAQAHFEGLLLALTFGPETPDNSEMNSDETGPAQGRTNARLFARFVDQARSGLRAIANTRDNLRARHDCNWHEDPRFVDLRRFWFHILLACACNARIRYAKGVKSKNGAVGCREEREFEEKFWNRWERVTRSAGLRVEDSGKPVDAKALSRCLVDKDILEKCKDYIRLVWNQMTKEKISDYSYSARAFVERHLKLFGSPRSKRPIKQPAAATKGKPEERPGDGEAGAPGAPPPVATAAPLPIDLSSAWTRQASS
jgi:hypothetical protein